MGAAWAMIEDMYGASAGEEHFMNIGSATDPGNWICDRSDPDEPRAVYTCDGCGCAICEGDYFFDLDGEKLCEECFDEFKRDHKYTACSPWEE